MKLLITSPFQQITDRPTSHRSAQAYIYADQFEQLGYEVDVNVSGKITDWSEYSKIAVYHGNDFQGGLNLYGGLKGFDSSNIERLSKADASKIISLDIDFPNYAELLESRIEKAEGEVKERWSRVDLTNLKKMQGIEGDKFPNSTNRIVIGDSHTTSMYRPGWTVDPHPFKTLHGALKHGLSTYVFDYCEEVGFNFEKDDIEAYFYFGNIDIRHHVCRLGDWKENVDSLTERYAQQIENLWDRDIPAKVYELLPIEDESRKLPKTGYYKGEPFWGSWEDRNKSRLHFRDRMIQLLGQDRVILWTDYLEDTNGRLNFAHMEKPKSVHLARSSYPYWTGIPKPETNTLESFL